MIFKVWGQNCRVPKHIEIANDKDLPDAMDDIFNMANELSLIDIEGENGDADGKKIDAAYNEIEAFFEKNRYLGAGDYMIIEAESEDDISIPSMISNDANLIFG